MVEKIENIAEINGSIQKTEAQEYATSYTEGFDPAYELRSESFNSMRCRCSCAPTPGPYCHQ